MPLKNKKPQKVQEGYITYQEFAEMVGLSTKTVTKLLRAKGIEPNGTRLSPKKQREYLIAVDFILEDE